MKTIDIVTIAVPVIMAIIGLIAGFGKSLKRFTGGIFGIIISIFVCVAVGGMILGIKPVGELVASLNETLAAKAAFLGKIHAGLIVYYIVLFLVVQILRIIAVKVICGIFEAKNAVMKTINRILGFIFVPAVTILFVLLVFSVVRNFEDTAFVQDILAKIEGSLLLKVYEWNPIVLNV